MHLRTKALGVSATHRGIPSSNRTISCLPKVLLPAFPWIDSPILFSRDACPIRKKEKKKNVSTQKRAIVTCTSSYSRDNMDYVPNVPLNFLLTERREWRRYDQEPKHGALFSEDGINRRHWPPRSETSSKRRHVTRHRIPGPVACCCTGVLPLVRSGYSTGQNGCINCQGAQCTCVLKLSVFSTTVHLATLYHHQNEQVQCQKKKEILNTFVFSSTTRLPGDKNWWSVTDSTDLLSYAFSFYLFYTVCVTLFWGCRSEVYTVNGRTMKKRSLVCLHAHIWHGSTLASAISAVSTKNVRPCTNYYLCNLTPHEGRPGDRSVVS